MDASADYAHDPVIREAAQLQWRCNAPAPLVVNGSPYVGCELPGGHEGLHEVTVSWQRA